MSNVRKIGKGNYAAVNKAGKVIPHKGKMSHKQATKQVEAIYISQHPKIKGHHA